MVMANVTGRATATSTTTDVASESFEAKLGVVVLASKASTQNAVVNGLVFILLAHSTRTKCSFGENSALQATHGIESQNS